MGREFDRSATCVQMELLFAYGALQDEAVQMATFGRLLQWQPEDRLASTTRC